jgi:hypothetical protein
MVRGRMTRPRGELEQYTIGCEFFKERVSSPKLSRWIEGEPFDVLRLASPPVASGIGTPRPTLSPAGSFCRHF